MSEVQDRRSQISDRKSKIVNLGPIISKCGQSEILRGDQGWAVLRVFPQPVKPRPSAEPVFCGLDIHARVEPYVHPKDKGMNQNSMIERISRWGEGLWKGHNSDWQS